MLKAQQSSKLFYVFSSFIYAFVSRYSIRYAVLRLLRIDLYIQASIDTRKFCSLMLHITSINRVGAQTLRHSLLRRRR